MSACSVVVAGAEDRIPFSLPVVPSNPYPLALSRALPEPYFGNISSRELHGPMEQGSRLFCSLVTKASVPCQGSGDTAMYRLDPTASSQVAFFQPAT